VRRELGILLAVASLCVACAAPTPAAASGFFDGQASGSATASPDWSNGSFSGSVEGAHQCPNVHVDVFDPEFELLGPPEYVGYCGWIPFATVGPGDGPEDCSKPGRYLPDDLGAGVVLVWLGDEHRGRDADGFDVAGVALNGFAEPLLCISVVLIQYEPRLCVRHKSTGAITCVVEGGMIEGSETLFATVALAEPEEPEESEPEGPEPEGPAPEEPEPESGEPEPPVEPAITFRPGGETVSVAPRESDRKKNHRKRPQKARSGRRGHRVHGNTVVRGG
jgi:hypothetical protein